MTKRVCASCGIHYDSEFSKGRPSCVACKSAGEKRQKSSTPHLTPRQRQIIRLVAEGLQNKEIAARLLLSVNTVAVTISRIADNFLSTDERSFGVSRVVLINKFNRGDFGSDVQETIKTAR